MAGAQEPLGGRLTDHIALGVLSAAFCRDLIEEVVGATGKREKRSRLLPADVTVRYVIGLGLFFGQAYQAYEEVMRQMTGTLQSLGSWDQDWKVPSTSAITQARQRRGRDRSGGCFTGRRCRSRGLGPTGAWLRGRRLMAIDGTSFDVPGTGDNAAGLAGEQIDEDRARIMRAAEYTVPDRGGADSELIWVITTVLDPAGLTAAEMAFAYHQRREHDSGLDEIKTHLRAADGILRSQSPDLIEHEMWGILLAHYAIRELMCRAADEAGHDPDRVSFIRAVRAVRRLIDGPAAFSPLTNCPRSPGRPSPRCWKGSARTAACRAAHASSSAPATTPSGIVSRA